MYKFYKSWLIYISLFSSHNYSDEIIWAYAHRISFLARWWTDSKVVFLSLSFFHKEHNFIYFILLSSGVVHRMKGNTVFRYIIIALFLSLSPQPYQLIYKKYHLQQLKTVGFYNTHSVTCDNRNGYYYIMLCVLKMLLHVCSCQNMHSCLNGSLIIIKGQKCLKIHCCVIVIMWITCVYNMRYHYGYYHFIMVCIHTEHVSQNHCKTNHLRIMRPHVTGENVESCPK